MADSASRLPCLPWSRRGAARAPTTPCWPCRSTPPWWSGWTGLPGGSGADCPAGPWSGSTATGCPCRPPGWISTNPAISPTSCATASRRNPASLPALQRRSTEPLSTMCWSTFSRTTLSSRPPCLAGRTNRTRSAGTEWPSSPGRRWSSTSGRSWAAWSSRASASSICSADCCVPSRRWWTT